MDTLQLNTTVKNGHIILNIPTNYSDCKVELVIIMNKVKNDKLLNNKKYDFSKFSNRLKWQGDAVTEQRKLRDEWK
ncbi:MAG: hypothetical protein U9N34_01430 [Candidatus Cloacimonadota bacterium]|nr:hypothetical protein [Candidatus Cloacimonadota bacterium]